MSNEKPKRPDWWPDWFTGSGINEGVFCRQFLEKHKLAYAENAFFTPMGLLNDESLLQKEICRLVSPLVTTNVTRRINSLIDLLTRFADSHPTIRLSMITAPNASVPEMVREGQVDMGFFYSTGQKNHHLQAIHLYREPAFLVASRQNPLSSARGLHYEDLKGMEFVYPHDSCCFVNMLISELGRRRIELKKVSFLGGMQLVVNQVRRKDTVTLAPQCALRRFEETYGLVRLDMQEKPLSAWETILLGSRAEKEAVQELLDFSMREARRIVREYRLETEEREKA